MIRINLLPIRQIKKRNRTRNEVLAFLASLAGLIVVLGIVGLSLANKITDLNTQISHLEQKKASYQPILNKIKKLQKDKENLDAKLRVINDLKRGSQITVRVLDEVANRTPTNRMWLKSIRVSNNQLQVTGVALDNATIAQYMRKMDASPFFANADLASSSQIDVAGKKLKSFSLTFQVAPPEDKKSADNQDQKAKKTR